jgi:hypothetical protein
MRDKTMLIIPDGSEAANAEKITLISAYLSGDAEIILREPDKDEPLPYQASLDSSLTLLASIFAYFGTRT